MPMSSPWVTSLAALAAFTVTACGSKSDQSAADGPDPALAAALAAPMMVDPDLVSRDNATAAIAGGGPGVVDIPTFEHNAEAIAAARAEAEKLAGGKLAAVPVPTEGSDAVLRDAVTAAQRARVVKGPGGDCADKADYAMAWSLRLPDVFAIYPRGHLLEAAGSDREGCRLRVVRFVTPVEPGDVIGLYYSRVRAARFDVYYRAAEGVHVLSGSNAKAAYAIQARKRADGMTETDIVVNGG